MTMIDPGVADIRLDGRVAIVTGAARGLGRAMAEGLARAGASVVLADVDGVALKDTVAAVEGQPGCGPVTAITCDITVPADCERAVAAALEKFGALHVLVNNAGKGPLHLERAPKTKSLKFWEADPDIWREIIVTNVNGTFLMARSAAPELIRSGCGRIVNRPRLVARRGPRAAAAGRDGSADRVAGVDALERRHRRPLRRHAVG